MSKISFRWVRDAKELEKKNFRILFRIKLDFDKDTVEDISSWSSVGMMSIEALLEDLNKYNMGRGFCIHYELILEEDSV